MKQVHDDSWLPSYLSDSGSASSDASAGRSTSAAGDDLLDAYSRAVISVVEAASPAVIALRGPRNQSNGGSGSGFLLTGDGFAVTNSHVVGGRDRLTATTSDGDQIDARVIGDDPATDLAVVRLLARDLPVVNLSEHSPLRVGQLVIAVGSPFGLESTVSSGIVSATQRTMRGVGGRAIDGVIQHTAPINPGNSGGPLLDHRAKVVGVNTATIAFAQGVGFAVPAETVRWIVGELIAHGQVARPTLGIAAMPIMLPRRLVRELDLLNEAGLQIETVEPASAAQRAGLQPGDVLIDFAGHLVNSVDDVHRLLSRAKSGTALQISIIRNERVLELTVLPTVRVAR